MLSKLYSNQSNIFAPILFSDGLNAIVGEIRLPENKNKDTHNLGKSTVGRLLDYMFLGRDPKLFLAKQADLFKDFVFFLELKLSKDSYVTIRRSVAEPSKISFKTHKAANRDFGKLKLSEWDHDTIPLDRAKDLLDGLLDWRALKPYDYRKVMGYLLRSQDDYRDVFHLGRFAGGHSNWKPFLAHILGFDSNLISNRYDIEKELAERKQTAQTLRGELGDAHDVSKVDGLLLIKRQEAEKRRVFLNAFDFRTVDRQQTKELVEGIDEEIAQLNLKRYSLNQNRKKILASLENDEILFDPDQAKKLFDDAGIYFDGQIKRDFEQLIAFNRAITEERRQYLLKERDDTDSEIKRLTTELGRLGKRRAESLAFLGSTDVFDKFKQASDELTTLKAEILDLQRQRELLQRLQDLTMEIRSLGDDLNKLREEIEVNVASQHDEHSLFSKIRLSFNEIVEEVIGRKAVLSVQTNKEGHLDFKAEILDEAGNATSADAGRTYKKLLCIAFDLAVLSSHVDDKFPRFVFHDGVFESLDPRKKEKLLDELRRFSEEGLQPIITLIDSELSSGDDAQLTDDEIILRLHDEGDDGRLFKMPSW